MTLIQLYERFLELKSSGMKDQARQVANELIEMYHGKPDVGFVYEICDRCEYKIDYFIWKEIVFPEILTRYESEPSAIKALAQVMQNLYQAHADWAKIEFVTEDQLIVQYLKMCPGDLWALSKRIEQLRSWLAYTIHEWPWALLYGPDAANREQCAEILEAIEELRCLDSEGGYTVLCNDVMVKVKLFASWLDRDPGQRGEWSNYYKSASPD